MVSGTGGLTLRAAGTLDPTRPGSCSYPAPPAGSGEPGEVPDTDADGSHQWQPDEFVPVLLIRTLTTDLPALLTQAIDNPQITTTAVCGGSLILAVAGLIEGRHATTHHLGLDMLDATGVHAASTLLRSVV